MSGICAVWRKDDPRALAGTLHAVCRGLSIDPREITSQVTLATAGVAVSARFPTQQVYRTEHLILAADADLSNEADLPAPRGDVPANARIAARMAEAYVRHGEECATRFEGNFSFVLWDNRERKLLAGIDRFGVNRLTYFENDRAVIVSSRLDALARSGEFDPEVDPHAILNVLNFGANLGPGTALANVHRISPGSLLIASPDGRTGLRRYWDMRYDARESRNEAALSRELEAVVERSVASQCQGGPFGEVGAFLSGGTDSSTVVGMMARTGRGRPKAFSIGFTEQAFNELDYANLAARKFGAQHHTFLAGPDDCFDALPRMVRSFDEPFANSSAVPTYFCARLAAQHGVKWLLAGDGGDELFGGNERYATDKLFAMYKTVPLAVRKWLIEPVLANSPVQGGVIRRGRGYVRRANMAPVQRLLSYHFLSTHSPSEVFEPGFLASMPGYSMLDIPTRYYNESPAREHLDRLLYMDVKMTLGDSDLPKVTCMAEMAGVQTRFPFLDRAVAEFSGRIPARLKVKGMEKRYLFKRAFRNLLPVEILQKKKHGFGIPVAPWLKSHKPLRELAQDTLRSRRAYERGYFRRAFVEDLFRKHEADDSTYYGDTLWAFLVLELWHRAAIDEAAKVSA